MDDYLEQLRWLLEQADRHLTGRPDLEVRWAERWFEVPGYYDDEHIHLNRDVVGEWFTDRPHEAWNLLLGLNFHELGHCLFTPGSASLMNRWRLAHSERVIAELFWVWNAVEDQRIERRLGQRFPFALPILNILASELFDWSTDGEAMAVLVPGRPFLSSTIRAFTAAAFVHRHGRDVHRRLLKIVNEYAQLGDKPVEPMAELTEHMHGLLKGIGWFDEPEYEAIDSPPMELSEFSWDEYDVECEQELAEFDAEFWDQVAEEWFRVDVQERKRRYAA